MLNHNKYETGETPKVGDRIKGNNTGLGLCNKLIGKVIKIRNDHTGTLLGILWKDGKIDEGWYPGRFIKISSKLNLRKLYKRIKNEV